jgi:Family of unknown function (DUF6325)
MTLGPVEILVLGFPENRFTGAILPELAKVVGNDTITIIDGLFVTIDNDGTPAYFEIDQLDSNPEVAGLITVLDHVEGLLSDDDVEQLTSSLAPGTSAAILVFEHTWVKPLRDAIVDAGGILLESTRVPGAVVSELQAELAELI